jgi:hypothetical protein
MTAFVLMLAGVTAGDNGVRAGAATAPLTERLKLDFSREWEGTVQFGQAFEPLRLSGGADKRAGVGHAAVRPDGVAWQPGLRQFWGIPRSRHLPDGTGPPAHLRGGGR